MSRLWCNRSCIIKADHVSVKFQITLPDDLAAALRNASEKRKMPLAEFIRETMQRRLQQDRAVKSFDDPFASISGILDSPETDLSSRIDEILYK